MLKKSCNTSNHTTKYNLLIYIPFQISSLCVVMASLLGIDIIISLSICFLNYACANCNESFAMRNVTGGHCLGVHSQYLFLSYHDCNFLCIQKTNCAATNYLNATEAHVCSLLLYPCHQLSTVQHMTYTFYTSVGRNHCLQWVNYNQGMVANEQ